MRNLFYLFAFCALLPLQGQQKTLPQPDSSLALVLPDPGAGGPSYEALLAGFLQNDYSLQTCTLQAEQARLTLEKALLGASPNVSVSTGTMSAAFSAAGSEVTLDPSATVSIPSLNNATITAQAPVELQLQNGAVSRSVAGAGLSVGADIVSSAQKTRQYTVEQAQRAYDLAQRTVQTRQTLAEQEFLTQLQGLLTAAQKLITAGNDLYDEQVKLRTLEIQGYGENAPAWRTANMNIRNYQNTLNNCLYAFQNDLLLFSQNCGVSVTRLPVQIPDTTLARMADFPASSFSELESAVWNQHINGLYRKTTVPFSLSGSLGYAYNITAAGANQGASETGHQVQGSLTAQYKGLSIAAGTSVPVTNPANPTVTFSFGFDLNQTKDYNLTKQSGLYDEKIEQVAVDSARQAYEKAVKTQEQQRQTLEWQKLSAAENLRLNADFLKENETWFLQGIIDQATYVQAQRNYLNALVNDTSTKIERLLYNATTKLLFTE